MKIDFNNTTPIYIQLVDLFKSNIISGKYTPGEKIPSVRELAQNLKVNPNTIQKALTELEDINLIYTERTNGKYVTNDQNIINKLKNLQADELTNKYMQDMKNLGLTIEEIKKIIGGK